MIQFKSYDHGDEESKDYSLPEEVKSVNFSYDGGRVAVYVNGLQVFYTALGGNDCSVLLDSK